MGEYVYTLRAKTFKATIKGEQVDVNLFSYLTKPNNYGNLSNRLDHRLNLGTGKAHKLWETKPKPKYVVNTDLEYIKEPESKDKCMQFYPVYTDLRSPVWFDNGAFPGTLIGFLRMHSGKAFEFITVQEHVDLYAKQKSEKNVDSLKKTVEEIRGMPIP